MHCDPVHLLYFSAIIAPCPVILKKSGLIDLFQLTRCLPMIATRFFGEPMSDILSAFRLFIYDKYTFWLKLYDMTNKTIANPTLQGIIAIAKKNTQATQPFESIHRSLCQRLPLVGGFVCCTAQRVVKSRGLHFKSLQHARNAEVAGEVEAEAD